MKMHDAEESEEAVIDRAAICAFAYEFTNKSPLNKIAPSAALRDDLVGLILFDASLIGIAEAHDKEFDALLHPRAIGPHFRLPVKWLNNAKSVISFFFPFSEQVIESNAIDPGQPSPEWLHARIEGQEFIAAFCSSLSHMLHNNGFKAVVPSSHPDFWSQCESLTNESGRITVPSFTSNWSERHVAYVTGLGTFGLSAGLITEKGIAGRVGSVVTNLKLPPNKRPYRQYNEYCTRCGACVRKCIYGAITEETGKNHTLCNTILEKIRSEHAPRYGCGKCQVNVPCSREIPRPRHVPDRHSDRTP